MGALREIPPWHAGYEALYRQHCGRVVRLCRLLLDDSQEAQDVVQEVFLKLARVSEAPNQPREWGAWLTRVTVNACRDRWRSGWWRWWRLRHEVIEEVDVEDGEPTPERAALSGEVREQVWGAFRQLPRRQREIFVLRHLEGWSTQEVADAVGVTTGSVKRHLFRAVQRLRKALGGRP